MGIDGASSQYLHRKTTNGTVVIGNRGHVLAQTATCIDVPDVNHA